MRGLPYYLDLPQIRRNASRAKKTPELGRQLVGITPQPTTR